MLEGDPARKNRTILSVGRFFAGGHSKRHDVMLDAFRDLLRPCRGRRRAASGRVFVSVAAEHGIRGADPDHGRGSAGHVPPEPLFRALGALYARAPIYWHATGYGLPPDDAGEKAEHFGISIVEAMAAGCVPLAYAAGGPCEIIEEGVSGFLFDSSTVLLSKTAAMLEAGGEESRIPIARRAAVAARRYSPEVFADAVRELVREAGLVPASSSLEGARWG